MHVASAAEPVPMHIGITHLYVLNFIEHGEIKIFMLFI
jgi:hypothetical protein